QRRRLSDSLRLRAAKRRDYARHHYHLFYANLDDRTKPFCSRRAAERNPLVCFRAVRRWSDGPAVAIVCRRISAICLLFAWLRYQVAVRNRIHHVGRLTDRAAGECRLPITVRSAVLFRRFIPFRRSPTALAN